MADGLEIITGYVERIVYRKAENGYTVFALSKEGEEETTCVGTFSVLSEGDFLELKGKYGEHPLYGEQFLVEEYENKEPEDAKAMERYLASGAIKGIGSALAARIVRRFKEDTFRVMEEEPERLAEIKGISHKMARAFYEQFAEKRELRQAMVFLQQYGISNTLGVKIYEQYKENMYQVVRENPYRMAEEIHGVGFKIADELAMRVGIHTDSDYRIRAGLLHVLLQATGNGHVYLPEEELIRKTTAMLLVEQEGVERQLQILLMEKKVVAKDEETRNIYGAAYYYMELNAARMLLDLNVYYDLPQKDLEKRLKRIEKSSKLELDDLQRQAVYEAVRHGVFILTGGPGTGKTTTINTMIEFFEAEGMDVLLAAPTGRAAKRMTETTGREARTIHRMLEPGKNPEEMNERVMFERNEGNPLETDVLIVDEMSMVDINLLHALLRAVIVGTRVIFVGDVNQLPSVGPGNVLRDMIKSNAFSVVRLNKIFRQAEESDIVVNAHRILAGQSIKLDNKSKDFFFLGREDIEVIIQSIVYLVKEKLSRHAKVSPYEVQVLTPMRKGELGVENLNKVLQNYLNPLETGKREKECVSGLFREGDKVMQIKNNYQMVWEIKSKYGTTIESGTGVFNGDCGIIREINSFAETITVEFDENRQAVYPFSQLEELELAYAVTIHKAQGSEYPVVVLPLLGGPRMLLNRNLLYTAITRAKSLVTIIGRATTVEDMIANESELRRYSGLANRLQELL